MDNDFNTETQNTNFGKEIAKDFAQSSAVSAGAVAGFLVVGLAVSKFQDFKKKRDQKNNPTNTED